MQEKGHRAEGGRGEFTGHCLQIVGGPSTDRLAVLGRSAFREYVGEVNGILVGNGWRCTGRKVVGYVLCRQQMVRLTGLRMPASGGLA